MGEQQGAPVEMTALFTDIEGSTRLWDEYPDVAAATLAIHDDCLRQVIEANGGVVVQHTGDGMIGRFADPTSATRAAIAIQQRLAATDWGEVDTVKVRIGIHTGEVVERPEGLFGWALNFCSRLMEVGHGGQILLSEVARDGLDVDSMVDVEVRDLGRYGLRDVPGSTRLLQVVAPGLPAEFPPPRKTISATRAIPRGHGPLFGRDRETSDLHTALATHPLVTVTGVPGVGKTRLAIELARSLTDAADGPEVLWCDLAGVESAAVVSSIMTAHAISVRPGSTPTQSLVAWLSERRSVLVLDRCDECLATAAALANELIEGAPDSAVVATSQHVLGVPGEVVQRLAPLEIAAATDLFLHRAHAAGAPEVERSVATEIASLLDGLPYAVEIAAANAGTFSAIGVRDALRSSGLAAVGGDDRVRAVRDAVGLAIDALEPGVRERLVAATVFAGPFDAAGFRAVCDPDGVDDLSSDLVELVDSSLLQPTASDDRTMFRLLDPVRAALREYVDRVVVTAAEERLRDHTVAVSGQVAAGLRGPSEQLWLRVLERQFDVMRGVFQRAVERGDLATAVRLCTDQWEWAFFRFNSEYFEWGLTVLGRFGHRDEPRLAAVHGVVALGHWFRDEVGPTLEHGQEALRRERELGAEFSLPARLALINAAVFSGAESPPPDVFAESEDYHRNRPEGYYRMNAEAQNAIMATWLGRPDVAERRALKALKIGRESGNPTSIAYAEWALGQAIEHDDREWAEHLFDEALRLARDVDNRWIITLVQLSLASSRRRTAGPVVAAGILDDLLVQLMRAGHWAQVWNVIRLVALCADEVGDEETAYRLAAAVEAADLKFPALPVDATAVATMMDTVARRRGEKWAQRTALIAATWSPTDAARAARDTLRSIIETA